MTVWESSNVQGWIIGRIFHVAWAMVAEASESSSRQDDSEWPPNSLARRLVGFEGDAQ